jgi:hypothetical protein
MTTTLPPSHGTNVRYGADWTFVRNFDAESFNKQHDTHHDATSGCPIDLEPLQSRAVVYHSAGGEAHPISSGQFSRWLTQSQNPTCPGGCGKQINSRDFGIISKFDQRLNLADRAFKVSIAAALLQVGLVWASGLSPVSEFARATLTTTIIAIGGRILSHEARQSQSGGGLVALGLCLFVAGTWVTSTPVIIYDIAKNKPEFIAPVIATAGTIATSVGNCISSVKTFFGW